MSVQLSFCNLPAVQEGRHGKPTLEVEKVRLKDWLVLQCSVIIVLFIFLEKKLRTMSLCSSATLDLKAFKTLLQEVKPGGPPYQETGM